MASARWADHGSHHQPGENDDKEGQRRNPETRKGRDRFESDPGHHLQATSSPFFRLSVETLSFHPRLTAGSLDGRNPALILFESFLCIRSVDRVGGSSTIHAEVFFGRRIPSDDSMFHSLGKRDGSV